MAIFKKSDNLKPGILKPDNISLQNVLLLPLVGLTVFLVALTGYISFVNGKRAVNDVAHQLRGEITSHIEKHLHQFLDLPERINDVNASAISGGLIDAGDRAALEKHFIKQVRVIDAVTSINYANTAGGIVNAGREGAGGDLYVIFTEDFTRGYFYKCAIDEHGNRTKILNMIPDFDARERPWYYTAVEEGTAIWSEAYVLFTGQDMNVTASRPVYNEHGELLGVTAVNLFISHLGDFLANLEISKTGQSFIIESSGLLIASSTGEKPFSADYNSVIDADDSDSDHNTDNSIIRTKRVHARESYDPLTRAAADALAGEFDDIQAITSARQFEFYLDGKRQLGQVIPLQGRDEPDWLIITIIPEKDFMARIDANNQITILLMIMTLLIALFVSIFITRRIARPISLLNESAAALAKGEWEKIVGRHSRITEIKTLSMSFNKMAGRLQEMIEGLNREVAERKLAETVLSKKEQELRTITDNMNDMIFMTDKDGLIMYATYSCKQMGFEPEELWGIKVFDMVHPDDLTDVLTSFRQVLETHTAGSAEYRFKDKEGGYFWVETIYSLIFESGPEVEGVVLVTRVITERKQAENEISNLYLQLTGEISKAEKIHQQILPHNIPEAENISIAAHYQPASIMGGDYYNIIKSGDKLIVYLSDVMGHGLDCAMLSFFVREAIDSHISLKPDDISPGKILDHLARQYRSANYSAEHFICIFMGVIDIITMEMTYSGAGFHIQPLVKAGDGSRFKLKCDGIFISNLLFDETQEYVDNVITLTPGTTIFFTTDGLPEQQNREEWFGWYYEDIFYRNCYLHPEAIIQAVNKEFYLFNNNSMIGDDDITCLVLQVDLD